MTGGVRVSKIENAGDQLRDLPEGLSFFDPIIRHEVKEELEVGGEAFLSRDDEGRVNGLFIYDEYEATGTIFTRSKEVFDEFFSMKPSSYIFSELEVPELPKELWNIWQLDVDRAQAGHRFRFHVSIETDAAELERFMAATQPETNKKWVRVALSNGDRCFVVKIADRIVACAWMTIAEGVARSHGIYVEPQFRRTGLMKDNFEARLIYLKSRHVHAMINEIAESNAAASSLAVKEGETIVGKIYLYTSPEAAEPTGA